MADEQDVWKVFWKRFQEQYPVAYMYEFVIAERVNKMWEDVSPIYEQPIVATWSIDKSGFKANMLGFLVLGATGEVVFENLTKYLVSPEVMKTIEANVVQSAKEAIKKESKEPLELLISVSECPKYKHPNDPTAKFCNQCGTKLESS
jgi:hypothetical protein